MKRSIGISLLFLAVAAALANGQSKFNPAQMNWPSCAAGQAYEPNGNGCLTPGSLIAANSNIAGTGSSINDDDGGFNAAVLNILTWSRSGSTVTFTNSGTNGFSAGQWINLSAVTGQPFGGGYDAVQISATGLTSTQFEVTASAGPSSCSSNCGGVFVPISVTAISQSGSTVTFTTQNTNGLHIGDWVNVRYLQSASGGPGTWPASGSPFILGTGLTLFKVLSSGLTSTQFEVNVGSLTVSSCSSNCGAVETAMNNLPYLMAQQVGMPGVANVYVELPTNPTIVNEASDYSTLFHGISPAATGNPGYLIISDFMNDVLASNCSDAADIEAAYDSLWSQAHTDGWVVITSTNVANNASQSGNGCVTPLWETVYAVDTWLLAQGKTTWNASSGEYTDLLAPLEGTYNDPFTGELQGSQAGGWNPAANILALCMVTGSCPQSPVDRGSFMGIPGNYNATANGIMYRARGLSGAAWVWLDPSGNPIAWMDTSNDALVAGNILCQGIFSTSLDARHCPTGSGFETEGGKIWLAPSGTPCSAGTYIFADGTGCGNPGSVGGTVTYTSSQTATTADSGETVIMNCASACNYTLPGTQPSTTWNIVLKTVGAVNATVVLGGSDTYNGVASVPSLIQFQGIHIYANSTVTTDYSGDAPFVAGSGVVMTPSSNGVSISASGGGGGSYVRLAQTVISGSSTASVTFSGISGSYTDLIVTFNGQSADASEDTLDLQFNGDTGSHYAESLGFVNGSGTSAWSTFTSVGGTHFGGFDFPSSSGSSTLAGAGECRIFGYTNATWAKQIACKATTQISTSYEESTLETGQWSPSTQAAVTSVTVFTGSGSNFVAGSTLTLYGIE